MNNFKRFTRSVLAIGVIGTSCYLAIESKIDIPTFMVLATTIIMFFFKKEEKDDE